MKPNVKITCETMEKLLVKTDAKLPPRFRVDMVVSFDDTYVARWENLDAAAENAESVSDVGDPDVAKAAYQAKGTIGFTAVWFNEEDDGETKAAAETLKAKDAAQTMRDRELTVVDAR